MAKSEEKVKIEASQEIEMAQETAETTVALLEPKAAETPAESGEKSEKKTDKKKKKLNKKWIKWVVLAVVAIAIVFGMYKLLVPKKDSGEILTNQVAYGSITSKVEGSGMTRAKDAANITVTTIGTVLDVYVKEGDHVSVGTPLYTIDSEAAKTAVDKAKKDVTGYEKQLKTLMEDIAGLNLSPDYTGKLLEVVKLQPGDTIAKDQKVAKLVDDTRFRLSQYYSYAYQGDIKVGQTASISVPSLMSTVTGKVEAVHMVNRISAEGSKLFEVVFVLSNPGTLTADLSASASVTVGGETVYPYEAGKLEYYRSSDLKAKVGGKVEWSGLVDYMDVKPGQTLVKINGEDSENEIFTLEQSLKTAQEALTTAEKNYNNMNPLSPIDGTVLAIGIKPGDNVAAGTTTINIANTDIMLVDAKVDERNVAFIKSGMSVDLDQWGTMYTGLVESVSLSGKAENGVSTFPAVISVENKEGTMMSGSYVTYSLVASQNDNCLVLPIQCIKYVQLEDGTTGTVVFVDSGKRPENAIDLPTPVEGVPESYFAVPVEIGISDNYNVEIVSGVDEGMTVFTQVQIENSWN
ncbi:MAG: HlyD family efflux transporter periplasmic adaptor subunit [Oscillospiraceae bacterium]